MFEQATKQTFTKLFTMKLFYHFLIFVFVSLILVACAKIFTSDTEIKSSNIQPSEVKQQQDVRPDSAVQADLKKDFFTITNFNYKNLLKTKRWADNQCDYNGVFYIKNVQMAINRLGRYTSQY
ncbi:hypothetical protein SAMN05428975_2857 [Mucilaginibacter sp. OK268]|uniref:hypothetical protein n=1 Tax=Mucilaginibacter sp. OK268 TaxID=1881048 RepID=UPI0008810B7E|nr:hypothetical protein [Mucilaginibacter sp. OK268]SDP80329.1 hypothetical protein SAMN05428975_2857 [Mucilaginibacter sp. OK268]